MQAERPIGRLERLCIEREERERELARQGHPKGYWFDQAAADFAVNWIQHYCRHHKGEWRGRPFRLEDWQIRNMVAPVYGWKRADGTRRYRKSWREIPRKNGKTQIASAEGGFLFIGDNEPGAEVYFTATTKDQAFIGFEATREMVNASPDLKAAVKVPKRLMGNLSCGALGSKVQLLAGDFGSLDGLSPHGDIRDEVHAWKDHRLADVLNTAMGARRQPLTLEITTAGVVDEESVGFQHHEYAVGLLEGLFEDDRQHVYITAIDEGDDPWDPAVWAKANPNLGISLKKDFIEGQANEARAQASAANAFLRLHLNRWTGQHNRWLDLERWRECDQRPLDLAALAKVPCYGGLDLSSTTDLTAFVLVFLLPDGVLGLLSFFWLPQERVKEEALKRGQSRYRTWVESGHITTTPGDSVDYAFIRKKVNELAKQFKGLREIGFDPYNAKQLSTELVADGLPMVEVRQGPPSLSEGCKLFEARILDRKIRNGGNPVMTWCVSNAVARSDANLNIAPDKKNAKEKIDGVSATVTALSRLVVAPAPAPKSLYETQGFKTL